MLIFICDDQKQDRELLKKYLFTYAHEKNLDFTIVEFSSGDELLAAFLQGKEEPAVLFSDIYMNGISGVDAACQMRNHGFSGGLIFTTVSREHAIEGFELEADGYLCKPYQYEKMATFLQRCILRLQDSFKSLTILSGRKEFRILLHKIEYIESCPHGCIIHAEKQVLKTRTFLSEIEGMLCQETCFIRCGRSYIVNMNAVLVHSDTEEFIHLKSGERILIPIRERTKVNSKIADFYWTKTREME